MKNPSKYQLAIFECLKSGKGHLICNAVAGGGKTTTAVEGLNYIPKSKKVLFLAYNKAIAEVLKVKVPSNVKASTIHAHGFSVLMSLLPQSKMDKDKVYGAITELDKTENWDIPKEERVAFFNRVNKIVDLLRLTLSKADVDACELLCEQYDIDFEGKEIPAALAVFEKITKDDTTFDFVDMVYIPASRNFFTKGFDFVFVDEFQDCCEAQYQFAKKLLKANGRLVVIGDRNQSIYGFLGASPKLFDEFASEPNVTELPLSVSYRCSKAVIRHAQKIVPHIEAREDAPEGAVVLDGSINNIKAGDFVLCRLNFPLVSLCLYYIKKGIKAKIKGSDIGKTLVTFIKKYSKLSSKEVLAKLETRKEKLTAKLSAKFPDKDVETIPELMALTEKIQVIEIIAEEARTCEAIIDKINLIYSDVDCGGITLSSIHKSKGLEAENVFVIEPQLVPFDIMCSMDWQFQQEQNLDYVLRTRAITKLEYVQDWTCIKKKKKQKGLAVNKSFGFNAETMKSLETHLDSVGVKAESRSSEPVETGLMPILEPNGMQLRFL